MNISLFKYPLLPFLLLLTFFVSSMEQLSPHAQAEEQAALQAFYEAEDLFDRFKEEQKDAFIKCAAKYNHAFEYFNHAYQNSKDPEIIEIIGRCMARLKLSAWGLGHYPAGTGLPIMDALRKSRNPVPPLDFDTLSSAESSSSGNSPLSQNESSSRSSQSSSYSPNSQSAKTGDEDVKPKDRRVTILNPSSRSPKKNVVPRARSASDVVVRPFPLERTERSRDLNAARNQIPSSVSASSIITSSDSNQAPQKK